MGTVKNWTSSYENTPASLDNPGQGDNQIRNLKSSVRNIGSREHNWTASSDEGVLDRQGSHKQGSAVPFIGSNEPVERLNGSSFEEDYDEGRLWIDTGNGGRLMYLDSVSGDGTPTWKPVLQESVGKVQAFVSTPDENERWVFCDGSVIADSDTSPDGTEGGFENLIDFLQQEADGDPEHPYYTESATSAKLPDLQGVVIRGIDSAGDRDKDGTRQSGGYQEDGNREHDHGGELSNSHSHTFDWEHNHDVYAKKTGIGSITGFDGKRGDDTDETLQTSTEGTDGDSTSSEDISITIPEDGESEATVKNVALYYYIKY